MALRTAILLADSFLAKHAPDRLGWNWEEAVLLLGLEALRAHEGRFLQPILQYHRAWQTRGLPRIDRSDRCAPALTALALGPLTPWAYEQADLVARYLEGSPRNRLGTLDHLGNSWLSWLYPRSVWVDSLMMYGVFAARFAAHLSRQGDTTRAQALGDFAARQPLAFARVLQDAHSGLFSHAYWSGSRRVMPGGGTFWLRGNAWALWATHAIIMALPEHPLAPPLRSLYQQLARSLGRVQRADGGWDLLLGREPLARDDGAGVLLVASAYLAGVRSGNLPTEYRERGERALRFAEERCLRVSPSGEVSLQEVSGPTNALPPWGYRCVPQVTDSPYGIGAYLLAAAG